MIQIVGALTILTAFVLAQRGTLDQRSPAYLWLNLVGSAVLAVEAYLGRDWGFLLLEGAWFVVTAWSLLSSTGTGCATRDADRRSRTARTGTGTAGSSARP
jgi:membrane-bound ClpP family serine protease